MAFENPACQAAILFGNQVLVVALVKGLVCEIKVALDEAPQLVVALTMQCFQQYAVAIALKVADLAAVTAVDAVDLAADPVLQRDPASAASNDASAPSADTTVVEASAVEAQGLNLWVSPQTSWFFSAVVLSASL